MFPDPEATQEGHPAAPAGGGVVVVEPPDGVEHADQPEACEQQVKEQNDAGGRWGGKRGVSGRTRATVRTAGGGERGPAALFCGFRG